MKENAFNIPTFLEFGACHVTGTNWVGGGVALMIWPIRGWLWILTSLPKHKAVL